MSPQVSWLFFKARAKRPSRPIFASCLYGCSAVGAKMVRDGPSEQRRKQPTGRGPWGCVENGPAAALLVGDVPHHFHATFETKSTRSTESGAGCALLAPCRRPILNATKPKGFRRRYTR